MPNGDPRDGCFYPTLILLYMYAVYIRISCVTRAMILNSHMQLVTCQCLTADSGVANLMPALSNSFVEIDQQIISTDILLPSADCQLQATVCA